MCVVLYNLLQYVQGWQELLSSFRGASNKFGSPSSRASLQKSRWNIVKPILQGTNGKRKSSSKVPFLVDMLVPVCIFSKQLGYHWIAPTFQQIKPSGGPRIGPRALWAPCVWLHGKGIQLIQKKFSKLVNLIYEEIVLIQQTSNQNLGHQSLSTMSLSSHRGHPQARTWTFKGLSANTSLSWFVRGCNYYPVTL